MPINIKRQQKIKSNNARVKFKSNLNGVMKEIADYENVYTTSFNRLQMGSHEGKPIDIHEESHSDEKDDVPEKVMPAKK